MKYMGSKARHSKEIIPIILKDHKEGMLYVEPFVGGGNVIDKIPPIIRRVGYDVHPYLISMWKAVSDGWLPPLNITEEEYMEIKNNKELYPPHLVGYVGFALSYGGKWFGGWRRDSQGKRDYCLEAYRSAIKQFPLLRGVQFSCKSVFELQEFEDTCTIYCDPPYKDTTKYTDHFDHERFYDWCRKMKAMGHNIFISEYWMPEDFKCVWEKGVSSSLTKDTGSKKSVEKLFTL